MENYKRTFIDDILDWKIFGWAKPLFLKYRQIVMYLFFGGCSFLTNFIVYNALYNFIHLPNKVSTLIAWMCSVIFAYNFERVYVFNSTDKQNMKEFIKFASGRIGSGLLDLLMMSIMVDVLSFNSYLAKFITGATTAIVNFIVGKLLVFKKKEEITK